MANHRNLIIIGSGPAGLTAAIYAARANVVPLIFEGKNPGGQLMGTSFIENWPGEKSILGPTLMANMRDQAKSLGCEFSSHEITKVDFTKKPFTIWTHKDVEYTAHSVIIATGAMPNKTGCPGEQEYWGKGVTTCAVCDGAFYKDKKVAIIGGGDTAMEDASFMTKFTTDITIVQILDTLTASHAMQERVLRDERINIFYSCMLSSVQGDGQHVTGMTITNKITQQVTQLPMDGIFIAIGLKPATALFKGQLDLTDYGYLSVKNHTHTSVEGIFSAGDVADDRYRQAITSAGSGCMAALDAERYLKDCGHI